MFSSAEELAGEDGPHLDWASGPVTLTRLSGCSRAAFTGVMELKRTPDRQPVKPREANPARSASSSDAKTEGNTGSVFISKFNLHRYNSAVKNNYLERRGGKDKWYNLRLNDSNLLTCQTGINLLNTFNLFSL